MGTIIPYKVSHNLSSCTSDSEILAAHQTVEAVLVPKEIVLKRMSSRCSRLVGPGKDFFAISIPVGSSSGLSM